MVHNDRHPLERTGLLLPALHCLLPTLAEIVRALLVELGVGVIDLREPLRDDNAHLDDIARVEMDVRIARGMDVAERAVDDFWDLEPHHELRGFDEARRARLDAVVA